MADIVSLDISDPPDLWADLGFRVDAGCVLVDGVSHRLGRPGRGISGWTLRGVDLPPATTDLDGLATLVFPAGEAVPEPSTPSHANGVTGLDHIVVATPDHQRTVAAIESAGILLRRVRETDSYGSPMRQAFFRLGPVILELIGPATPSGDGPARFFGLAWTCADLDATGRWLGGRLHPSKEAVQPGRRIATLDRGAASAVAQAFMSAPGPLGSDDDAAATASSDDAPVGADTGESAGGR